MMSINCDKIKYKKLTVKCKKQKMKNKNKRKKYTILFTLQSQLKYTESNIEDVDTQPKILESNSMNKHQDFTL